jgi:hypothetical protein
MITSLVYFVIYVVILGLIAGLLIWLVDAVPVPQPFNRVAKIVITVLGVLILILLLLNLAGLVEPPGRMRPL